MHPATKAGFIVSPFLVAGLCIALGIPLALGKIRPNSFYGFRVAKTLNDESVWYKVNRFTGKAFIVTGIVMVALSFVVLWLGNRFPLGLVALQLLAAAIIFLPIAVAVIASGVVCHKA